MKESDQPFDLLIRSGTVVSEEGSRRADVGVQNGRIAAVGELSSHGVPEVIDAGGKLVLPGCIDPHTHMGIPIKDTRSADDFRSGSIAAACGGTTTILDFTVQGAGQTLAEALQDRLAAAAGKSYVDYGVHVNVTDQPDRRLPEIEGLVARGLNSFKAFSTYKEQGMMIGWDEFRRLLEVIQSCGGLLMLHSEDNDTITRLTRTHLAEGHREPIYHARSRPPQAEALAIEQATRIAGELGAQLYLVHVSSRAGLEAALRAREQQVQVYIETCPQYLVLDEQKYREHNGHHWITTPPLRTPDDVSALWKAIEGGHIDAIGTDHCPFTTAQKDRYQGAFDRTPNGLPGVENRLALLYTYGVAAGRISLERMVSLLAANVARIFDIETRKGAVEVGKDADLVIWDPAPRLTMTASQMHGNADFTPYEGLKQQGRLRETILRGQVLVRDGKLVARKAQGELVTSVVRAASP